MLKNSKKILLSVVLVSVSSAVIAAVEPKNVVMFFLPVQDRAEVSSVQEAVPTKLTPGMAVDVDTQKISEKDKNQKNHGIITPAGVSLYDKGGMPLDQAQQNVLAPARVLILPDEKTKTKKGKKVAGTPDSVTPMQIRVFSMQNPAADMKKAAAERPVVIKVQSLRAPENRQEKRPADEREWTGWILRQLEQCDMDVQTVLPTLYWMTNNKKLTDGKTDCDMKTAVAGYLRKCHPWPVVYYTPVNNDVPRRAPVQMAVEYLENTFDSQQCPVLDLSGVNFEKTDFLEGSLSGADFSNSYLQESTFSGIDLSDAIFNQAKMNNVLFQNVDLTRASFENATMKYVHLHRVNASSVDFDFADLQNAQFRDVNLSMASLRRTVLQNTAWVDVRAYRVNAFEANFEKAGLDNVLFNQMSGIKANFAKIFCKNCVFKLAKLKDAQFYKASFNNVSFDKASIPFVNFKHAFFEGRISFDDVFMRGANFSDVDLTLFKNVPLDRLRTTMVDSRTLPPEHLADFDAAIFDVELANAQSDPTADVSRYSCSRQSCEDRLLGRVSNQNLAVRAMTMLENPTERLSNKVWALCTMGCIAKNDKKLENSQVDILAAFVKRERPWSSEKDLFKPYTPIPAEVQMALFVLTDPELQRDLGHDVDLTGVDLRTANLSGADLQNVDLSGSHLGGADLRGAKTDKTYARFDQAVIDEYTLFPVDMKLFKPFRLPDSATPPWWKPKTVHVIRDGMNPWTVVTEDVALTDEMVVQPKQKKGE